MNNMNHPLHSPLPLQTQSQIINLSKRFLCYLSSVGSSIYSTMESIAGRRGTEQRSYSRQFVYEDFQPSSDWTQDSECHILLVDLPGFKKEELKLQVDNLGKITVGGERWLGEGKYSRFKQVFSLPEDADADKIKGKFDCGLLFVIIPKKAKEVKEETKKQEQESATETEEEERHETSTKEAQEKETTDKEEEPKKDDVDKGDADQHVAGHGIHEEKNNKEDKGSGVEKQGLLVGVGEIGERRAKQRVLDVDCTVRARSATETEEEERHETSTKEAQEKETTDKEEEPKKDDVDKGDADQHVSGHGIHEEKNNKEDKGSGVEKQGLLVGVGEIGERRAKQRVLDVDCMERARKMIVNNKGVIVATLLAFSVGLYISRKLHSSQD